MYSDFNFSRRILEYFEDEAELSGSDASSDEDEDLQEENDAMEEELGDLEHYSEDEIKDQVGRMHMYVSFCRFKNLVLLASCNICGLPGR